MKILVQVVRFWIGLAITFGATVVASAAWPTSLVAPYVDFTAWPPYDIVGAASTSGLRYATLAFIVADTSQNAITATPSAIPAWGGYTAYSAASAYRLSDINHFRAFGGDVIISFGGASGIELAQYITDSTRLKTAYQSVINTYSATRIDFDIEGAAAADSPSVTRRSVAMAALQADAAAAGKTLRISLTLPVLPSGLDNNGLAVLQSAVSHGVDIACVNIMAMDYGDNAAPNPSGHMGDYAIQAATNLFNQIKSVHQLAGQSKTDAQLWQMVGVTPMLGVNDLQNEIFDQAAAAKLVAAAETNHYGMLAFWSMNRDQPGASGITQSAYQFTELFLAFSGGGSPTPAITTSDASVAELVSGTTNLVFTVSLTIASASTVSVAYATSNGTATSPGDYGATSGTLTFAAGETTKTISVSVPGHATPGANKVFYLNLSGASGASLLTPQVSGTIINNNASGGSGSSGGGSGGGSGAGVSTQWQVTYDGGAAFQATLTLSNPGASAITINSFAFDGTYTNIEWIHAGMNSGWVQPTKSGNHFTMSSGWPVPAVIPAGGSLQLTYQGTPGGSPPAPSNIMINGTAIGAGPILKFTGISRQGRNMVLSWTATGGTTNYVQASSTLNGNDWTTISQALVISGGGNVSTTWTDVNALNSTRKFYRVIIP